MPRAGEPGLEAETVGPWLSPGAVGWLWLQSSSLRPWWGVLGPGGHLWLGHDGVAWGGSVWGDVTVHLGCDVLSANGVVMARYQWDSDVPGPGWGGDLLGVIRQRCPGC